jgi:3-oxoacyl-[acyl-carrier-protein] synthase-3
MNKYPSTVGSGLRTPVGILGIGQALPGRVVTNEELCRVLKTTDEWITFRTGIRERRFLEAERTTSDLCIEAGREALRSAGVSPGDLDAIVLATSTPDQISPSTGTKVAEALGAPQAMAIDLNQMACSGGVLGMLLAAHLLQNDRIRTVLVIGAEVLSRVTDPKERLTRIFFGDAAGAAVLGRVPEGYGLLSWDRGSLYSQAVHVVAGGASKPATQETVDAREHYMRMDGREVWKRATEVWPGSIARAVEGAGVDLQDIRLFALHQVNINILGEVMKTLDIPIDRVGITLDRLGNTSAAGVFTVLHQAHETLAPGDLVVVSAIGAGFMWGSICLRYS